MGSIVITIALGLVVIIGGFVAKDISTPKSPTTVSVIASSTSPTGSTSSIALDDSKYEHASVTIAGKTFDALVSDTPALQELGLSGRTGLKNGQVMLFIFDKPDFLGFWMKDMHFSLDMLWLDRDMRVVSFKSNVAPDTYPQAFYPTALSQYVVELPAGMLASLGVKAGDQVVMSRGK